MSCIKHQQAGKKIFHVRHVENDASACGSKGGKDKQFQETVKKTDH